jgi:thiol-disulfide isomerase/thioredoxin
MPDVQLFDADNESATLSDTAGEPVLVNLWASWCAPCVKELPTLDALSRRAGSPRVIGISLDVGPSPSVDAFLDTHGIEHLESWHDPKMAIASALKVQVMPTTIYYDREGREIWRYLGDLDWTGEEAAKLLAEELRRAERRESVPEQLVDAGLGASSLVNPFDDDRAGEGRAAVLGRQGARNDDRIGRNPAVEDFAGRPLDDLGRCADEHAHRKHRALFDDDPLGDLRPGADEAVVLDDDRAGLKRLEHSADPGPPEMWTLRPIWAQLPTVAQVSIIAPSPTRAPILTKLGISTAPGAT